MFKTLPAFLIFIFILFPLSSSIAVAEDDAIKVKKVKKKKLAQKVSEPVMPQDPYGDYMKAKLDDYQLAIKDASKVRIELVQYFGKRERNYINHLVRNIQPGSLPQIQYANGYFQILINGKMLELKVDSLFLQKYSLNDFAFQLKDFDSLKSLLEKIDSKLNVFLNVRTRSPLDLLIDQAYAQPQFHSETTSLSIIVFLIQLVHGKSETCLEGYLAHIQELSQYYYTCQSEIKDYNPQNLSTATTFIKQWDTMTSIFYINSENPCQDIGAYLDNENSLQCHYAKQMINKEDDLCVAIFQINTCVEKLIKVMKRK